MHGACRDTTSMHYMHPKPQFLHKLTFNRQMKSLSHALHHPSVCGDLYILVYKSCIAFFGSAGLAVLLRAGFAGSTDVAALMQTLTGVLIIILLSCLLAGILVWALVSS